MNVYGITLNFVCICFLIFLIILYYSKKSIKNTDTRIFPYMMACAALLVFNELIYYLVCYYMADNMAVISFFRRASYLGILYFFIFIGYYVILIAIENNKVWTEFYKQKHKLISRILIFVLLLVALFQFILPLEWVYRPDGYINHANGPGSLGTSMVVGFGVCGVMFPIIYMNRKLIDKKKILPFLIVAFLEFITLLTNFIDPAYCPASISLTLTCFVMYHTIDNPDLKLIASLELARSQAEKSNNAKTDFLSSMSHEIRTPLNAIVGLSQMINENNNLEEIHQDSKDILVASQNLLELVNGILDINKLEANKMEMIDSDYNPREVFDNLVKLIKIRIGDKPLELRTHYPTNLPLVLNGDKEKVRQILSNLLTNAVKYTEKGVVDFIVECENSKDKCNLHLIVKDTGRGMKKEQLPKLFTKFYRLEEDKDSDIEGTGLGLAITKSLVELFNGKIIVDSTYGVGSTFTVIFSQKIVQAATEAEIQEEVSEEEKAEEEEKPKDSVVIDLHSGNEDNNLNNSEKDTIDII